MTKKFTEEQYQKIVEEWGSAFGYEQKTTNVVKLVSMMITRDDNTQYLEALALANPASRELMYDKYVEKEKKYIWDSKEVNKNGDVKRLYDSSVGVTDSFRDKNDAVHVGNWLTETEVKKWGYNPDMFDNREV